MEPKIRHIENWPEDVPKDEIVWIGDENWDKIYAAMSEAEKNALDRYLAEVSRLSGPGGP